MVLTSPHLPVDLAAEVDEDFAELHHRWCATWDELAGLYAEHGAILGAPHPSLADLGRLADLELLIGRLRRRSGRLVEAIRAAHNRAADEQRRLERQRALSPAAWRR